MTLGEILKGKSNVYVAEYTTINLPNGQPFEIFTGGCFYVDNRLVSLDGDTYNLNEVVDKCEWRSATDLKVTISAE